MFNIKKCLEQIKSLVDSYLETKDNKYFKRGLKECSSASRRIKKRLKCCRTVGNKQKLMNNLNQVISYRSQFKSLQRQGAGIKDRKETARDRVHWDDSKSAFKSRIRTGVISNLKHKEPKDFLVDCGAIFRRKILYELKKDEAVKVNVVFCGDFELRTADKIRTDSKYFTTPNAAIYRDTNLTEWFNYNISIPVLKDVEEFQEKDSGWALKQIINLSVNINKFTPQLGSSYIELPAQIRNKGACINIKNKDEACFAWAVTSALYPVDKKPERVSKYPHYSKVLKLKGIQFPMTMKQIPNFEKQNNISINVYILKKTGENFITLPTRLTKNKMEKHVNLLWIQDQYTDNDTPVRLHYVWIKNLSRLLSSQLSKEKRQIFVCDRCLHYFRSKEKLEKHSEDCAKINKTAIKMPSTERNILQFNNYQNKENVPFVIYADLESILKPTSNGNRYQEHEAAAVGYYVKCSYDDELSFYRSFRGPNCMKWFADELNQFAEDVETVFLCPYDIDMTPPQNIEFKKATHCHICGKNFNFEVKVRDHNHLIAVNNYRGAAHKGCNVNYKDRHTIPVVFHNLSGYDANFVIEDIAVRMKGKIDLLPITKEKYISFTKYSYEYSINFRFIDSFRFMASSLDQLASYLVEFPNLTSQFPEKSKEHISLLTKKGILPYDYIDSSNRFDETSLPPIEDFYNELENKPCPREKYIRAQLVWEKFQCRTLGEYSDIYMKTDILLLADVFEQFRTSCHKTYGLDPANYFTLPGYTWDAMLKYTKQALKLLTDIDMYMFVERGIRGGLSQVCGKRRAHANNKYIPNYDPSKPENYLMYFDINNQYGWAMSQYLPYDGFEWVDSNIDVAQIADDAPEGYILEVDLEYPKELHDIHKDLPFCPQHNNSKTRTPCNASELNAKLMATLDPKVKYVIHYRNLKQALRNGLILTKIHRVLKFKQSAWLKSYVDLNTNLRKNAKNEFEKNLFKLMNNAVFGKTMENVRNRVDVHLLTKWEGRYGTEAYISKPEFKNRVIFNENLVAVELQRQEICLNKPIYVGMSILDIAKTTIYDFHYNYMKEVFGADCIALYTDTDSVIYEVFADPYEVMKRDCHEYFDTSDYPIDNQYGIPQVNKKVLGMMKDENNGVPMTDYVGLRSKLYTIKNSTTHDELDAKIHQWKKEEYNPEEIESMIRNYGTMKKAKGIKKSVVKNKICFEDYIDCLETKEKKIITQNLIKAKEHRVYSLTQQKIALSSEDDKRCLVRGSFDTLPWGHYSLIDTQKQAVA
ncbi:uncharacterized protein LOC123309638 [Coccinella septempunctata]|uniref:uncharacterized protein LOC123309638 n=1 Tax=Coccinella septempunctata TaxID=41139 RepID=UPI001D064D96|nr:uncharacterized protein LOC123309638 [Coccinella septempunctata]